MIMVIRTDSKTKKEYTYFNIPLGEKTSVYSKDTFYIILNEKRQNPNNAWYNDRFIGDRYAVFKWVKTSIDTGFFQQVTKWYTYFGCAKKQLYIVSNS